MIEKIIGSTAGSLAIGFVPFAVLAGFAIFGWTGAGLLAALALSAGLVAYRIAHGNVKTIEVVLSGWFAVVTVAHFTGWGWGLTNAESMLHVALAGVAWIGLAADRPFTIDFARDDWPEALWQDRRFIRINQLITTVWGLVFLLAIATSVLSLPRGPWLAAMVAAIALSALGPKFLTRRVIGRELAKANPYDWKRPATGKANADEYDAIVIGSGIGGLTAAALMAKEGGLRVRVFEHHNHPGGFCHSWPRKTHIDGKALKFHFDAGVHDISGAHPGGTVDSVLGRLGVRDRINWLRTHQEYAFPGLRLKIPDNVDDYASLLIDRFPAEKEGIHGLFATIRKIYDGMYDGVEKTGGVPRPSQTVDGVLAYPKRHPELVRWQERPFSELLDTFITEPRLKEIFSTLTGYLTDRPGLLTAGAMAPIFGYYFHGGFYPEGGSQRLADVMVQVIRDQGGEVSLACGVKRILTENGAVKGVELLNGDNHHAPIVISNADLGKTLDGLLQPRDLPADYRKRFAAPAASTSAFSVQLGVDFIPEASPLIMGNGLDFAIAIPSLLDHTRAPEGHSVIELLSFIPTDQAAAWNRDDPGYKEKKRQTADHLIAMAEEIIPGLSDHIVFREESSPATFDRYVWTGKGAIYGPALGASRPPMKTPIRGLMLAGSGVFPGAGIEAVVISGALAAEAVVDAHVACA